MLTPYDWQESITHRASYVNSRLETGSPVLAVSLEEGVLIFTVRRHSRKIFEIYDRLAYSAIGQQSDVESLRVAAVEFAHQEGFQRSESDVTIQRVVGALSQPLKRAFGDLTTAPFVVRALFVQMGSTPADDVYQILDYDGDFTQRTERAYLVGSPEAVSAISEQLNAIQLDGLTVERAVPLLQPVWARGIAPDGDRDFAELTKDLTPEAALLERGKDGYSRFRTLFGG